MNIDEFLRRAVRELAEARPAECLTPEASGAEALDLDTVVFMAEVMKQFFLAGLARATPDASRQFEQLATLCHGGDWPISSTSPSTSPATLNVRSAEAPPSTRPNS